ncbi:anti-sigma factor [Myxococcota bacterium]|nr:anti-sigma factor [Myxococcota bacterium]
MTSALELERLEELLTERFDRPLTAAEEQELRALLARHPDWRDDDFDLAAGALLAATLPDAQVSDGLRDKLLATIAGPRLTLLEGGAQAAAPSAPDVDVTGLRRRGLFGWMSAAAASVAAVAGWWPRLDGSLVPRPAPPPVPPTVAERRARLLETAKDVVTLPFSAAGDPLVPSVEGDLVWSTAEQRGFMRFAAGMPVNEATVRQYQLWIFDQTRDERFPVDGGLFDVSKSGEVVIEVLPRVPVRTPTLFAVTLEPSGGVVVSNRDHILVVAKLA